MSAPHAITLRPCTDADMPLLFHTYASTRVAEMEMVPWTDEQKHQFLAMQFQCQHVDYHQKCPDASYNVIVVDGQDAGRLYLDRRESEFRIIDITLLPECRGRGIGGTLLSEIITEATAANKPVTIHVEKNNPAQHLYQRLGFVEVGGNDVYYLMERAPTVATN